VVFPALSNPTTTILYSFAGNNMNQNLDIIAPILNLLLKESLYNQTKNPIKWEHRGIWKIRFSIKKATNLRWINYTVNRSIKHAKYMNSSERKDRTWQRCLQGESESVGERGNWNRESPNLEFSILFCIFLVFRIEGRVKQTIKKASCNQCPVATHVSHKQLF